MTARATAPGLAVCALGASLAFAIHALLPGVPALTVAVVLGIVAGQIPAVRRTLDAALAAGIRFSSKSLMRAGIVLLGLGLSLGDIAALGAPAIAAIVVLVIVTFFATWGLGRMLRLPGREPLLVAAGFSICGASAIGAMGAATGAPPKEQATPVALVTLCGTLAIAVLPALQAPLGLSAVEFGRWVGAGVHDVGQVVATAQTVTTQTAGAAALAVALVVKLTRVLMLAPMVAIASGVVRRTSGETVGTRPPIVPLFIVGFLAAVLLSSFVALPDSILSIADVVQSILLATALFALGTAIRLESLLRTGWRALIVGFSAWVLIAVLALAIVRL